MTQTVQRRKIEVLVDEPLVRRIAATATQVGIKGYTILPTLSGAGEHGTWSDDLLTGAEHKVMFVTVTSEEKAAALVDALAPLLDSYRLLVLSSIVDVIRSEKF